MFSNWEFFQFHQITFLKFNFGLDDVTKGWHSVTVVQSKFVNFSICLKDIFSDIQLFLGWNNMLASLMILWMQYFPPFFIFPFLGQDWLALFDIWPVSATNFDLFWSIFEEKILVRAGLSQPKSCP